MLQKSSNTKKAVLASALFGSFGFMGVSAASDTDNSLSFAQDKHVSAFLYSGSYTTGLYGRVQMPVKDVGLDKHFGQYADHFHVFGHGLYGSGDIGAIDYSQFAVGGGMGAWYNIFKASDDSFAIAAEINLGLSYANHSYDFYGGSHDKSGIEFVFDWRFKAKLATLPDLTFGLGYRDTGTRYASADSYLGILFGSYDINEKLFVKAYLGSSSAIGLGYAF
ncbi:hypothetical protein [Thiomicrospira microaerophila]|uniref:hypothetical protein n=1 Tax=Thiomicrospira microaerophila TaxID=406020 RepID=UPI0005C90F36|nr:hypothetical protein [Thiomicrospira microaerophila]